MLVPRSTVPVGAKVLLICTAYLIFSQTEKEPGSFLLPNRVIITRGIIFMPAYCAICWIMFYLGYYSLSKRNKQLYISIIDTVNIMENSIPFS